MVDLNSIVKSTSRFILIEYISILTAIVVIIYIVTLIMEMQGVSRGDSLKKKIENKIIVSILVITIPLTALMFTINNHSKLITENNQEYEDILTRNISLLLGENRGKVPADQLTLKEIETYIQLNSKYFMIGNYGGILAVNTEHSIINDKVKKYVFEEYNRNTPLYKELIIESKKMFE